MIDGLTIWLALVGFATIAMFVYDAISWLFRKLGALLDRFFRSSADAPIRGGGKDV